jgi:PAS domain S-box-containing protein
VKGKPLRARGIGIRWRSTIASAVALALTAAAFAVALSAAADSRRYSGELSRQLVPAAAAADDLLRLFAAQQTTLRDAVTSGSAAGLSALRDEGAQFARVQAQLARLTAGDQPLTARLRATGAAYRAWQAGVAAPQAAALARRDAAAARARQADITRTSLLSLAVRTSALGLTAQVISEQQQVTDALDRVHATLLASLIAMIVVVALTAAEIITGVWRGLLRPVGTLNKAVAAVAEGQYHRAIPAVGPPELAEMSRGIERMRTRLVAALHERERAEETQRSLFDLAPDAMVAVARDGLIAMANARAVQVFGYPADDLIGRSAQTLVPAKWREQFSAETVGYFAGGRSRPAGQEVKAFGLRRDGGTFPAEVRLSWLPTEQGTLIVAAIRDVSERLALAAERERLRAAAEREQFQRRLSQSRRLESLGQLVGGVAHDFNNLLSVIAGYADFTAEQLADLASAGDGSLEPVRADVGQIQAAAQQAIRVTRQLLVFARGEAAAEREVLDLNEVVKSAGELLRRSLGEQVELVVAADPGLWRVAADQGQLEQVLVNLAVNARDAMPGGGRLTIGTGNAEVDAAYAAQRPGLEPGRYCRLTVSDTGTGMDAATIERVFEPFFSTKPRGRGTGLGLATVYGIVSGLGGTIDIYSEQGLGTTMSVLLPVTGQDVSGPDTTGAAAPEPAGDPRGHGERILLVEDEEGLRTMASRLLDRNGYQVRAAAGGADAVRLAQDPAQRVDLLVTDMIMPGMLGNEVAARVRAARPRLPVLFVSGYAEQVLDYHGIPAPDVDVDIVQKPFTEAVLLSRVRRALDRAAAHRAELPGARPLAYGRERCGRPPPAGRIAGTHSLVTRPCSAVSSSMMAKAAATRPGESTTIVTAGTRLPSCSSRSPCGAWSPWKPHMPRCVVAPLIPAARSRRTIARWTGWPSCRAASDV